MSSTQDRVWVDVAGYEGIYQVSVFGTVRTAGKLVLKQATDKGGYRKVNLYPGHGAKPKRWSVHHIVLLSFVGPRPRGLVTRHLDGNPANNNLDNLCWGTYVENEADKANHGTRILGESHHQARFTEEEIHGIMRSSENHSALGKRYGVSPTAIRLIREGKNWNHITKGVKPESYIQAAELRYKGENGGNAKLTEKEVLAIRNSGESSNKELSRVYGVGPRAIWSIRARKTWTHI